MTPEWLEDGRKVPDDVMYYIRRMAVYAVRGATGMIVSQLVEVQPLPCEKGKCRRRQGCPKKLLVATQQGGT
ncbi:MAG: hypothetical protein WC856_26170, partial [Methylococcaceae bacterium]